MLNKFINYDRCLHTSNIKHPTTFKWRTFRGTVLKRVTCTLFKLSRFSQLIDIAVDPTTFQWRNNDNNKIYKKRIYELVSLIQWKIL